MDKADNERLADILDHTYGMLRSYGNPEPTEIEVKIWRAMMRPHDINLIAAAFAEHMKVSVKCPMPSEIIARIEAEKKRRAPPIALPATKSVPAPAGFVAGVKKMMAPRDAYWTPDRVVTQSQVNFIVRAASGKNEYSQEGRFLSDCVAAGIIIDGRLCARRRQNA